jgi:poly(A) polymerase
MTKSDFYNTLTEELLYLPYPGSYLQGLYKQTVLLHMYLPQVAHLATVDQPVEYHPEGDVFTHTVQVLNNLEYRTPALVWAALLHDTGKLHTARLNKHGRISFPGHEQVSERIASTLLVDKSFVNDVCFLVRNHMRMHVFMEMRESKRDALVEDSRFGELLCLHKADRLGSNGDLHNYGKIVEWVSKKRNS